MKNNRSLNRSIGCIANVLIVLATGVGPSGCAEYRATSDEKTNESADAIGFGVAHPNPPNSGVVYIRAAGPITNGAQFIENGTGTFIDDDWILTAAHVVHDTASPMDVEFRRGNWLDPNAEVRRGRRIVIHPLYNHANPQSEFDVALVQLDQPFSASVIRFLSNLAKADIVQVPLIQCLGYGIGGPSCPPVEPSGTLRSSTFIPNNGNAATEFSVEPTTNALIWKGDSGGPCIDPNTNEILGVISEGFLQCDFPGGRVISVDAFRNWASLVTNPLTLYTINGDFDLDGKNDIGGLRYLGGGQYVISILFATGTNQDIFLPIQLPAPDPMLADAVHMAIGNFGAGIGNDIAAIINGSLFYFDSEPGAFVPHAGFVPVSATYSQLAIVDSNNDGFDDVEAILPDGTRDLYFGSPTGLDNGSPVMGMPTPDGKDGKFMALVSRGSTELATPVNSVSSFQIIAAGDKPIAIQVFDGDEAYSTWDIGEAGSAVTCYDFWYSSDGFSIDTLLFSKSGVDFDDNSWSTLYAGNNVGVPNAFGDYYYIVDTRIAASGDCALNAPGGEPPNAFVNSFKIRATGTLFAYTEDLAFIGFDVFGDWAFSFTVDSPIVRDTTYDGSFTFYSAVPIAGQELVFRNADADVENDDPPLPVGDPDYRGPLDQQVNGVAVGKSDTIQYSIYDPNGNIAFTDLNPSGNNDGVNDLDEERIIVPTQGMSGFWTWAWSGVFINNDIRIWAPVGSPLAYPMMSQRTPLPRMSSAEPLSAWISSNTIPANLPVNLGTGNQSIVISSATTAQQILNRRLIVLGGAPNKKAGLCHKNGAHGSQYQLMTISDGAIAVHLGHGDDIQRPMAISALAAELLVTKLNVTAVLQLGEPLPNAQIYGTDMNVATALAETDALLVQGNDICRISASELARIERLTVILRSVNSGAITYNSVSPGRASMQVMATPVAMPQAAGAGSLAPL